MKALLFLTLPILLAVPALAQAALPSYTLTLHNGELTPQTLHVKAGERFKIELHNTGNTPVEFESTSLRKEKVMGPGVSSFVVVHPLKPGEYDFFDEFHLPDARGTLVAE
ncbi:cupredoxin domain-containing protein [Larsenimonas rhizosphaerae]|uniref:cupredoxin domain-containing protein n=1 Tax=Larsenimonas rhizosphaerae TaxID=2944682 RepID=UPI0020333F81|nr:cupredoxin domain-containing protein [Larsenimonas rhizosphaerae]MCM2129629.1 cupredoxin domain-containing protein [Larsenimonas rhizosphaerae]